MKNIMVLAPIGQRDVQYVATLNNKSVSVCLEKSSLGDKANTLLNNKGVAFHAGGENRWEYFYDKFVKAGGILPESTALCFPLLEHAIELIAHDHDDANISKIVLFNTDRGGSRESEPTAFTDLIARGLPEVGLSGVSGDVEFERYHVCNDEDLYRVDFFRALEPVFATDIAGQVHDDGIDAVYLLPSGGMPAMGMALIALASLYVPDEKLVVVEQPEGRAKRSPFSTSDFLQVLRDRHAILRALDHQDFSAARNLWNSSRFSTKYPNAAAGLILKFVDDFLEGENAGAQQAAKELKNLHYAQKPSWFAEMWNIVFPQNGALDVVRRAYFRFDNAITREDWVTACLWAMTLLEQGFQYFANKAGQELYDGRTLFTNGKCFLYSRDGHPNFNQDDINSLLTHGCNIYKDTKYGFAMYQSFADNVFAHKKEDWIADSARKWSNLLTLSQNVRDVRNALSHKGVGGAHDAIRELLKMESSFNKDIWALCHEGSNPPDILGPACAAAREELLKLETPE